MSDPTPGPVPQPPPPPTLIDNNPIAVLGAIGLAIGALLNVFVAFGLEDVLTEARQDAIRNAINPVGVLVIFYLIWRKTRPKAKVVLENDNGVIRAGDAALDVTGQPALIARKPDSSVAMVNVPKEMPRRKKR